MWKYLSNHLEIGIELVESDKIHIVLETPNCLLKIILYFSHIAKERGVLFNLSPQKRKLVPDFFLHLIGRTVTHSHPVVARVVD